MRMIDAILAELDQEAHATRRVLERVPQAQLSWRPHPKSMSMGQLALHVATMPGNVAELAALDTFLNRRSTSRPKPQPPLNWYRRSMRACQGPRGAWRPRRCGADATWRLIAAARR